MGRKFKKGLDYFPFDLDFFQDDKIQFISARFGLKGESITIRLLTKIYKNGYFIEWDEDTTLLFAKSIGDGNLCALVNDVVGELLKRGFFDNTIFESFGVLTSSGIQKRYFEAVGKRGEIDIYDQIILVNYENIKNDNINRINIGINRIDVDINTQRKEKKRKEKERKGNEYITFGEFNHVILTQGEYDKLVEWYGKKVIESKIDSLDVGIENGIKTYTEKKNHYATIGNWCRKDFGETKEEVATVQLEESIYEY